MVLIRRLLRAERRRENAGGGTLQRGAEIAVLGFCSLHGAVAAQRACAVVHGRNSVELALPALRSGAGTRFVGSAYHRVVPATHLHGSLRGARSAGFHGSRRCSSE